VILAAVVFIAVLGSMLFFQGEAKPFRAIPELDIKEYRTNAKSLRGNVYRVQGEVDSQLDWSPNVRFFSVLVGDDDPLPVKVPKKFDGVNIQKGQKFIFVVDIDDEGIPTAKEMKKV